ncbi:MAG: hypothetical protein QUS33_05705 [Dehalococcoidia bacterium]|nr:hypothetical protein [Dehalococcoidia bacterium]
MRITDFLRRRPLQLLLIVAWLALGTVMVVLRPNLWIWFATVCYLIAAIYIAAEVLTWKRMQRQKGTSSDQVDRSPPTSSSQSGDRS